MKKIKKISTNEKKEKDFQNDGFNVKFFCILMIWALLSGTSVYLGWDLMKKEEIAKDILNDNFLTENQEKQIFQHKKNFQSSLKNKEEIKKNLKKEQTKITALKKKKEVKKTVLPKKNLKKSEFLRSSTWFSDYSAMKKNVQYYNEIHPFIYGIKGDLKNNGELISNWSHKEKLYRITELRELNPHVEIIPTIFRWENEEKKISEVIGYNDDGKIKKKHIDIIMKEIETYGYDGIDIDYEGMECHKKPYFEKFIKLLSKEMKQKNKILSVAVHPKTFAKKPKKIYCKGNNQETTVEYRESWRGPTAHDYSFFAKYTDRIKIMAYELHPRKYKDPGPGPQAPNSWLKEVIKYAQTKIPNDKLYMAIPTYGYDWGLNCKPRVRPVFYGNIDAKIKLGSHYQPTNIEAIVQKYGKMNEWKNLTKFSKVHSGKVYEDPSIWYTKDGCDRVAFYMNREAFEKKMELLISYKLGGFSFWQLRADNDPKINIYLSHLLKRQFEETKKLKIEKIKENQKELEIENKQKEEKIVKENLIEKKLLTENNSNT